MLNIPLLIFLFIDVPYLHAEYISLGAYGDSFYEYLLKGWIQSNRTDEIQRQMYDEAIEAIEKNIILTSPNGLTYVSRMKKDKLDHQMDHLSCFSGKIDKKILNSN